MRYTFIKETLFCLPSRKADDTPSPSLSRVRSRLDYGFTLDVLNLGHHCQRRASLDFRSIEVTGKVAVMIAFSDYIAIEVVMKNSCNSIHILRHPKSFSPLRYLQIVKELLKPIRGKNQLPS